VSSNDPLSRSEHYRDVADNLRRLARQTRFPEVRQELFDLAEGFERMAEFADKWNVAERQS
jgi:hypothetical protein